MVSEDKGGSVKSDKEWCSFYEYSLAKKMAKMEQSQRVAFVMDLFGRSFHEVLIRIEDTIKELK